MFETTAISFEGEKVKVVSAKTSGKNLILNRAETFNKDELDIFLRKDTTKSYILVYNFQHIHEDYITIPPIEKKLVRNLIHREVIRIHPQLREFSEIFFYVGDKTEGGRILKEYLVISFTGDELDQVIRKFNDLGKRITALYPDFFAPLCLIPAANEQFILVFNSADNKVMLLVKEGGALFMRVNQAIEPGTTDLDIQSINMTINHIRQSLRISPAFVTVTGTMSSEYEAQLQPIAPLMIALKPSYVSCDMEHFNEYLLPLSAICSFSKLKDPLGLNIIPKKFRDQNYLENYLSYSTAAFVSTSVVILLFILLNIYNVFTLTNEISLIRADNGNIKDIVSSYNKAAAAFEQHAKVFEFLRRNQSASLLNAFLAVLVSVDTQKAEIESVALSVSEGAPVAKVSLTGKVKSESFAEIRSSVDSLSDNLKAVKNVDKCSSGYNLKDKSFKLELQFTAASGKQQGDINKVSTR
ncbi:MAG: hypothetical protein H7844_06575 [Nitrospirae bacterium YQR-1]